MPYYARLGSTAYTPQLTNRYVFGIWSGIQTGSTVGLGGPILTQPAARRPAIHQHSRVIQVAAPSGGTLTTLQFDEVGTGTDTFTNTVTKTVAETGSGTDATTKAVQTSQSETGTGTDALLRTVTKLQPDTGAGTDILTKSVTKAVSDTGTGSDALSMAQGKTMAETGVGSDTLLRSATEQIAEAGVGSDQSSKVSTVTFSETGVGGDVPSSAGVESLADSGVGAESFVLSQRYTMQLGDVGAGVDGLTTDLTTPPSGGTGDVGWFQRSSRRTGRRGLSRARVHARPLARTREMVLSIADYGFGSDALSFEITTEQPPLYVSDILSAADDLQDDIVDLLMAGVI